MIEVMLMYAMTMVGIPYKWGGNCPLTGLDCSGFVLESLRSVGMDPMRDATSQTMFDFYKGSNSLGGIPKRGDLLFFGKNGTYIRHIAIALDSRHMIEAGGGGSKTHTVQDAEKTNAMVRIRPINNRYDFVAALSIF